MFACLLSQGIVPVFESIKPFPFCTLFAKFYLLECGPEFSAYPRLELSFPASKSSSF